MTCIISSGFQQGTPQNVHQPQTQYEQAPHVQSAGQIGGPGQLPPWYPWSEFGT